MTRNTVRSAIIVAMMTLVLAPAAFAAEQTDIGQLDKAELEKILPTKPPYSPYANRNFPTRPYFGDTHLHTGFSLDAGAFGARLTPRDAYRFARGEQITSNTGQPVKLSRPLDFLVVADHSDGMGFFPLLMSGDPTLLATPQGRKWYDLIKGGKGAEAAIDIIISFGRGQMPNGFPTPGTRAYRSAWMETIKAADAYNDPGRFTAFIGYEWTSNAGGNNLHRNVIFRENGDKAGQVEPFTTLKPLGSENPEDLWKWMAAAEEKTGSEVLAIAHNGNLSNGLMFPNDRGVRQEDRPELRGDARQMGTAVRDDPDQGDRRGAPVPLSQRRVRQLRTLGQGEPGRQHGEEEGDARVRVCAFGPEERPYARERNWA